MEIHKPEEAFRYNIRILTLFGAGPYAVKHPFLRFTYNVYGYCLQIFYLAILLPQLINLYVVRSDLENLIDSSFVTLTCIAYLAKILLIIFRGRNLKELLKKIHDPVFCPQTKAQFFILQKYTQIARRTSFVFISICTVTSIVWSITPLLRSTEEKELLLAAWFPYNATIKPIFVYTYASQAFLLINTACMNSTMDTMITNFYLVMVGQIEILKMNFKQLADIIDVKSGKYSKITTYEEKLSSKENKITKQLFYANCKETMSSGNYFQRKNLETNKFYEKEALERLLNKRIIKCSKHYEEIIKYFNDVTNFFEIGITFQVCASSIIICTATYKMTTISPKSIEFYVIMQYQMCMLIEIFLYCYRGHEFTIKAAELKDAVYECEWISVPNVKFRKSLCLIMAPLQIPIRIIVGKFFVLSMDTFLKIIKMAYSIFILLKQIDS